MNSISLKNTFAKLFASPLSNVMFRLLTLSSEENFHNSRNEFRQSAQDKVNSGSSDQVKMCHQTCYKAVTLCVCVSHCGVHSVEACRGVVCISVETAHYLSLREWRAQRHCLVITIIPTMSWTHTHTLLLLSFQRKWEGQRDTVTKKSPQSAPPIIHHSVTQPPHVHSSDIVTLLFYHSTVFVFRKVFW